MRNVMRVLRRDILRLLKTPAALVVVLALLVLPSVYTWYNVLGFWNPYEDTGNLQVGVVNQDSGATSELTGDIDVGDMIVDQLKENDQLGWRFQDFDSAMTDLKSGASYAVFVIPEDFSQSLLGLVAGESDQPDIEYYVNEKAGPVAPKITDTGATTLDETINASFVSTVSDVVVESIDTAVGDAKEKVHSGTSAALSKADEAMAKISDAKASMEGVRQGATSAFPRRRARCRRRVPSWTAWRPSFPACRTPPRRPQTRCRTSRTRRWRRMRRYCRRSPPSRTSSLPRITRS